MGKKETDTVLFAIIGVAVVLLAVYLIIRKCCFKKKNEENGLQLMLTKNQQPRFQHVKEVNESRVHLLEPQPREGA